MTNYWVVRETPDIEGFFEDQVIIAINFNPPQDVSGLSKDELKTIYVETLPDYNGYQIGSRVGQLFRFVHEIQENDIVLTAVRSTREICIGKIAGPYVFEKELHGSF